MKINKKVQGKYFNAVKEGRKPFEIRLADFDCHEGDVLVLEEQKDGTKELTGRKEELEVLFKFNTKEMKKFHTKEEIEKYGFVVLGVRKKFN
jgi:ASC-1-like (ASCH) protein